MSTNLDIKDIPPVIHYVAQGTVSRYPFPFAVLSASDLAVYVDGVRRTDGYTVEGAGDTDGGAVVFAEPPAPDARVTLRRQTVDARLTDFQEGGALRARTLNQELDRLTAVSQERGRDLEQALRFPRHEDSPSAVLPGQATRARRVLGFDADGAPLATRTASPDLLDLLAEGVLQAAAGGFPGLGVVAAARDLRQLPGAPGAAVWVRGATAPGDGGHGLLLWDATTEAADDGGLVYRPDGGGAWTRVAGHVIDARWFGLKADGTSNDAPALQAALDAAGGRGGGVVLLPCASVAASAPLEVPAGVTLDGLGRCTLVSNAPVGVRLGDPLTDVCLAPGLRGLKVLRGGNDWISGADTTSIGVELRNCRHARVEAAVQSFHTGVLLLADANGCVHNDIHLREVYNCRHGIVLRDVAGGWVNSNHLHGGRIGYSSGSVAAAAAAGLDTVNLTIEHNGNANNNNVVTALALEIGNAGPAAYPATSALLRCDGQMNDFIGLRFEDGGPIKLDQVVRYGPLARANRIAGGEYALSTPLSARIHDAATAGPSNVVLDGRRRGALLRLAADLAVPMNGWLAIPWGIAEEDGESLWNTATPTDIVIPPGVRRVRVTVNGQWRSLADGERRLALFVGGALVPGGFNRRLTGDPVGMQARSAAIAVAPGDILQVRAYSWSVDADLTAAAPGTWVEVEILA